MEKLGQHLVGKKLSELPRDIRVAVDVEDGEPQITTCDYNPTRFRVHVENGVITTVTGVG